jgi:hypothetical protein
MSCHTLRIISMTAIAVSIISAPLVNAQQPNNPLHPSYFAAKNVGINPISTVGVSRYVDARNPLHPTFARAGDVSNWHTTGGTFVQAYVDANNPLHPKFTRN